jgi:membrane protease YdiL (CAAX protease family)
LTLQPPALVPEAGAGFSSFLETVKPLIPIPILGVLFPALWVICRNLWRELDEESNAWRARLASEGKTDLRPVVALVLCALILTLQEYYGGRVYYDQAVRPWLARLDLAHPGAIKLSKYDELYSFGWWSLTRVAGYVLPFGVWKFAFPEDSLLDMGLRVRGFFAHMWIYAVLFAIVVPPLLLVAVQPDFGAYYPFYKGSSRSWYDFLSWEAMYYGQFFGLEMFFRGFLPGALRRSFGSGAIFAMAVPYCMIHFGKPFLEANGAIIAGVVLGSLALKTRSIYGGFLLHITVAALMDWLALFHRHALPTVLWPPG